MGSKREKAVPRQMRKVILVICEGETEENYINLLKKWYKSPIKIISHVEGSKISPSLVENRVRELKISQRDNVQAYLIYDMDVPAINEKLQACNASLLLSNPCFELWLLLHAKGQRTTINTDAVIKELKACNTIWGNYVKSSFTETQKAFLRKNTDAAIERAVHLNEFENPSTNVYLLIQKLKETRIE